MAINTKNNSIRWLDAQGDIPCARAAHATVCDPIKKCVFLFGGRFGAERLNDLYIGDLTVSGQITWKKVEKRHGEPWPCGRSWHTLSTIGQDAILLYGGNTFIHILHIFYSFSFVPMPCHKNSSADT